MMSRREALRLGLISAGATIISLIAQLALCICLFYAFGPDPLVVVLVAFVIVAFSGANDVIIRYLARRWRRTKG